MRAICETLLNPYQRLWRSSRAGRPAPSLSHKIILNMDCYWAPIALWNPQPLLAGVRTPFCLFSASMDMQT